MFLHSLCKHVRRVRILAITNNFEAYKEEESTWWMNKNNKKRVPLRSHVPRVGRRSHTDDHGPSHR